MAFSDEFTTGPLNAGWTKVDPANSGTTITVAGGALHWVSGSAYTDMVAWKADAVRLVQPAAGDFDVTIDAGRNPGNNFDAIGLYVDDATTGNFQSVHAYFDEQWNVAPATATSKNDGVLSEQRLENLSPEIGLGRYQRLKLQNTTLSWFVSADGATWTQMWSGDWSGGAAQRVGIVVAQDRVVTWDIAYFRHAAPPGAETPGAADCRVRVSATWVPARTRTRVGGAWLPA